MTQLVGIVADDLTSAADGAGPFRAAGLSARIILGAEATSGNADVIAIDTNSRQVPPEIAVTRTVDAVGSIRYAFTLIKTIDSTLRGNIVSETRAALAASGRSTAILAPAFPAENRTTVDGVQLLEGIPVDRTAFGTDSLHPARVSNLFELFPDAAAWKPGVPEPGIVIADARSDADLDAVVAGVANRHDVLWVGSPGLAAALARTESSCGDVPAYAWESRRTLIVVGSRADISRQQLARLVPPGQTLDAGSEHSHAAISVLADWLSTAGLAGLVDNSADTACENVAKRLADLVADLFERKAFDALFATGGATARALLERLRVRQLILDAEPEPGIVAVRIDGDRPICLLLKAGGFGDPDTFRRLYTLLHT